MVVEKYVPEVTRVVSKVTNKGVGHGGPVCWSDPGNIPSRWDDPGEAGVAGIIQRHHL